MTIFKGSRYYYTEEAPIEYLSLQENEAAYPVVWYQFPGDTFNTYIFHVAVGEERLDQIAYKYYKNSSAWWKILEANPSLVDVFNIAPGTVIRVPK